MKRVPRPQYEDRKRAIALWKRRAVVNIDMSGEVIREATALAKLGLRSKDALHVACAILARCHYFLTTDKGILKKQLKSIDLLNPVDYIRREDQP